MLHVYAAPVPEVVATTVPSAEMDRNLLCDGLKMLY